MLDRLTEAINEGLDHATDAVRRGMARLHRAPRPAQPASLPSETGEVQFRSLDPVTPMRQQADAASLCVCPVTRQPLIPGNRVYQCHACKLSYSQAGWDFLRQVDKGRCCGCRSRKTILPLH